MELKQLISKRTYQLLKERKWTQYKLAQRSALPLSTLYHVLSHKGKSVTMETLLNICRGFDISLAEFFGDKSFDLENIADD